MQRVDGDGFYCVVQRNWEDPAKVDAPHENEDVVLLWPHEKIAALKFKKEEVEKEWRESIAKVKEGSTTQWRP
eukprot:12402723-Karenia_brevis.AAC.1